MNLDTELRLTYDELSAAAPSRHVLDLHSMREPRHRVRTLALATAVVAVLGLVPAMLLTLARPSSKNPGGSAAPEPSGINWTWQFSVKAPPTIVPQLGRFYATRQVAEFSVKAGGQCAVTMYGEHLFDSGRMNYTGPVDINGSTGYFGDVQANPHEFGSVKQKAIVWKAVRDNWIVVACWDVPDVRATELSLARGVSLGGGDARVPFVLGHVPSGYRVVNAIVPLADGPLNGKQATILLLPIGVDVDGAPSDTSIDVAWFAGSATPSGQKLTINGHAATFSFSSGPNISDLFIEYDGSYLQLRAQNAAGSQQKPLVQIAEGLTMASNPLDPTTWPKAPDAIP